MYQGYALENTAILTYMGLINTKLFGRDTPRGLNKIALKRKDGYDPDSKTCHRLRDIYFTSHWATAHSDELITAC